MTVRSLMQLFGVLRGGSGRLQRVERADVLDVPADRHHVAHAQGLVELGDRLLDEEITDAADLETDADVVAQVDELGNAPGEAVRAAGTGTVEQHPLRTDRQADRRPRRTDIDRQRLDGFAATELDRAALATPLQQVRRQAVVSPRKLATKVFNGFSYRVRGSSICWIWP